MQEKREIIEKEIYTLYGQSGKGVYLTAMPVITPRLKIG